MNDTDFAFVYGEKNKRKDIEQAYISYYSYVSHWHL